MIRRTRVAFAIGVLVLASACGSQGGSLVGPEDRPAQNAGGGPLIGGNAAGGGGDVSASSAPPTAPSDTTARGGGPLIGGN